MWFLNNGYPVRRNTWRHEYYLWYDKECCSFIESEVGRDWSVQSSTLPLKMEDLLASDWEDHLWDDDHIVGVNKKENE
jgi:hypothetical protein